MINPRKVGSNAPALDQPSSSRAKSPLVRSGKSGLVTKLLSRPKGATVSEISGAANWQAHSVRAFLSGLRKKGMSLGKEDRKNGDPCYRLMPAVTESANLMPAETRASGAEAAIGTGLGT